MMNLLVHKLVCPYLIVLCKNLLNSFPGAPVCVFVAKNSFGFTAIHGSSLSELYIICFMPYNDFLKDSFSP